MVFCIALITFAVVFVDTVSHVASCAVVYQFPKPGLINLPITLILRLTGKFITAST
jgi:hypothetical protein